MLFYVVICKLTKLLICDREMARRYVSRRDDFAHKVTVSCPSSCDTNVELSCLLLRSAIGGVSVCPSASRPSHAGSASKLMASYGFYHQISHSLWDTNFHIRHPRGTPLRGLRTRLRCINNDNMNFNVTMFFSVKYLAGYVGEFYITWDIFPLIA